MLYRMDPKCPHAEAMVDGVTIVMGGGPIELDDDQIKRLKDIGVKMEKVEQPTPERSNT